MDDRSCDGHPPHDLIERLHPHITYKGSKTNDSHDDHLHFLFDRQLLNHFHFFLIRGFEQIYMFSHFLQYV